MSISVEFGNRPAANAARDEYGTLVFNEKGDRRKKTVEFVEDTPDHILEQILLDAEDSRREDADGADQVGLSDGERGRIDFSKGRASISHARSVKGIARREGVEDWLSYYDPQLTVDEHREVMNRAARESGSRGSEEQVEEKAARAAKAAKSEQCNHAEGGCKNGDPEACEFLNEVCGYSEERTAELLGSTDPPDSTQQSEFVTVGGDGGPFVEMEVTPQQAGALRDSWQGYKAGVDELGDALKQIRNAVTDARQAFAVINRIRGENGREEIHPDRLHELLDSLRQMPESIPETRTLDHFGEPEEPSDVGDVTPVSEMTDEQLRQKEPTRPDPAEIRPDALDDVGNQEGGMAQIQ